MVQVTGAENSPHRTGIRVNKLAEGGGEMTMEPILLKGMATDAPLYETRFLSSSGGGGAATGQRTRRVVTPAAAAAAAATMKRLAHGVERLEHSELMS